METITETEALCFLQSLEGFHNSKIEKYRKEFDSYSALAQADESILSQYMTVADVTELISTRELQGIHSAYASIIKSGIRYYAKESPEYPDKLANISSPPVGLYVRGRLPSPALPTVAIIGARNCTAYGRQMARLFSRELAKSGIQIISGLARGIDGIAQGAALDVGGYTCGVLGCGVDICYPKENQDIYDLALVSGGIISEYPPKTAPIPRLFPARNRIISGLSDAILVIEARERSGTLITVNMALEQGKDVYSLPGRINDPLSYGCNKLISEGAIPLLDTDSFLDEFLERFNIVHQKSTADSPSLKDIFLTTDERLIMSVLDFIPKSISEIYCSLTDRSSMSIPALMQLLTNMTMQKKIRCIDGCNYYIEED